MMIRPSLDGSGHRVYVLVVDGVTRGVFGSLWDAIVCGVSNLRTREDRLEFVWDASMVAAWDGGVRAIDVYKTVLRMFGESL